MVSDPFSGTTAEIIRIAEAAGQAVMRVYRGSEIEIKSKEDGSPVTSADHFSNAIIVRALTNLAPSIPILSEEGGSEFSPVAAVGEYWAVDPLDGTKEFVARNGEFTVNVGLVIDGKPSLGVVHAPALDLTYAADAGCGAWRRTSGDWMRITPADWTPARAMKIVGSRQHAAAALSQLLGNMPPYDLVTRGSSLKICMVADGTADFYARLGPTSIWDTAAAQAVVSIAGGILCDVRGAELRSPDPRRILNPSFFVCGGERVRNAAVSGYAQMNESAKDV